jgi:hypothetical protein
MYQSKKMLSGLGMKNEKIDACPDECMLFWKEHAKEKRCLKCGQLVFVAVVNEDGDKMTIEVPHKQFYYFPVTPRWKRLFISKITAMHMRWHNEAICENYGVMVHSSMSHRSSIALMQTLLVMQEMFALGW